LVEERTRELEIAQEELLRRERLAVLGQLTATVSHELRNPLGTIRSSNFYLQRKVKEQDSKIIKHLNRIDAQVGICDSIVNDLLEYTRGRHVDAVEAAINPWLDKLLDQILEFEKIKISKHLSRELPTVPYDQEKLRRVIINVVDNAIQAVKAKEQEGRNKVTAYHPEIQVATRAGAALSWNSRIMVSAWTKKLWTVLSNRYLQPELAARGSGWPMFARL
jgi:signal transduction histidine kinase